jgi:hypothetical protein
VGGIVKAVKSVVDAVAPIASMIPGVGMFAMAAKAAMDIGGGLMDAMDKKGDQDSEDKATAKSAEKTATAFKQDADNLIGGAMNMATQVLGGGVGGLLGGL